MDNNDASKQVITRFPPSPTGPLHIGNVRTALFNYFFARQNGGKFIVRIEDTDKARSKKEYELGMLDSLAWLSLSRDGELWRQSERREKYKKYLHKLIDEGKAYISKEIEGENKEVVRFKNPNKVVTFEDLVRGTVSFDTTELKDFIIARNINEPVYHLAVVVDDFESGVTHIMRGEDHISNTPRHILLLEALGAPRPIYAHLPLILAADHSKLSKRRHGEAVSLDFYRKKGYLPHAIINYLALVGWNPGGEQEIFTLEELIQKFDISKVQKGGAIFDEAKLRWVNKEQMKRIINYQLSITNEIKKYFPDADEKMLEKIAPMVFERIEVLGDIQKMKEEGELGYFFTMPEYDPNGLCWKKIIPKDTKEYLSHAVLLLEKIDEKDFTEENVRSILMPYAEKVGKGSVLWPMRFSLSGRDKSPDPFALAGILGKEETIRRMTIAEKKLKS